jgi:hypothetical protein
MRNFPTKEELETLSLDRLRLIPIENPEQEALIQQAILGKMVDAPVEIRINKQDIPTDFKTPEEEKKYQEILDTRKKIALEEMGVNTVPLDSPKEETPTEPRTIPTEMITPEMREAGVDETTVLTSREEVVAELGEEAVAKIEDEAEPVAVPPTEEIISKKKFCEFCDSKGVRHKLNCTRPDKT